MNKQKFIINEIQQLQQFVDQLDDGIGEVQVSCNIDDYIDALKDKYFSSYGIVCGGIK